MVINWHMPPRHDPSTPLAAYGECGVLCVSFLSRRRRMKNGHAPDLPSPKTGVHEFGWTDSYIESDYIWGANA